MATAATHISGSPVAPRRRPLPLPPRASARRCGTLRAVSARTASPAMAAWSCACCSTPSSCSSSAAATTPQCACGTWWTRAAHTSSRSVCARTCVRVLYARASVREAARRAARVARAGRCPVVCPFMGLWVVIPCMLGDRAPHCTRGGGGGGAGGSDSGEWMMEGGTGGPRPQWASQGGRSACPGPALLPRGLRLRSRHCRRHGLRPAAVNAGEAGHRALAISAFKRCPCSSSLSLPPPTPQAHFSTVTSLALSPDGWLLLSGARDKVVVMWDLRRCVAGWLMGGRAGGCMGAFAGLG